MENVRVYRVLVSLLGVDQPAVWRRFVVPEDFTLNMVHTVFQMVMGWQNCHAHEFVAEVNGNRRVYGEVDGSGDVFGVRVLDEGRYVFGDVFEEVGDRCVYTYDFGDNWVHSVVLEEVIENVAVEESLRCLDGEGACPPEDCGGVPGYAELLESLRDSRHPEYEDRVEWLGEDFDPFAFDCAGLNEQFSLMLSAVAGTGPVDEDMEDEDILEELNEFLASDAVSGKGMTLMMVDGFLAALAILPVMPTPGRWMSLVWDLSGDGAEPEFASDEKASRLIAVLLSYAVGVAEVIQEEPDVYAPLYDELILESDEDRLVVAREWCMGFMAGAMFDERVWELTRSDANGHGVLAPIVALSGIAGESVQLNPEEVVALMESMGDTVMGIKEFWLPWRRRLAEEERTGRTVRVEKRIGRNDPCPCGSGKKYKVCCGK